MDFAFNFMSGCPVAFHENKEYATCTSPIMHLFCFSFLLGGITAVPREIENNAYAKFWGANKVHYVQVAYHHGTVQPQPQINQVQTYIYEIPYVGETFDTILWEEGFTSHPWTIYYP